LVFSVARGGAPFFRGRTPRGILRVLNFGTAMVKRSCFAGHSASRLAGEGFVPSDDKGPPRFGTFDKSALLGRHPLFRELGRKAHDRISAHATMRDVRRGATIFRKGDPGTCLFAVCAGTVEVIVPSLEGKNAIINLIRDGDVFGEIALLDGQPRTADAVAFTDCSLMVIDRRDFIPLLREQPDLAVKLLEVLCARVRRSTEQVEELMFLDLKGRLAKTVLQLWKAASPPGRISITQRELGEIAGLSREEVNKRLRQWAKEAVVRLERRTIIVLQPAVLMSLAAK
jgi:CRP/FNR family transcriptional regulator, cyclic AMP receptor protein